MSSAEVRRLWEEPSEEIGLKSDSVGLLAACGVEDVKFSAFLRLWLFYES